MAHGKDADANPFWITAIATVINSDLFATGSHNGEINLYQLVKNPKDKKFDKFKLIKKLEAPGFVNALKFNENGQFLFAGTGQEHKLGRWWCNKQVRNSLYYFKIYWGSFGEIFCLKFFPKFFIYGYIKEFLAWNVIFFILLVQ